MGLSLIGAMVSSVTMAGALDGPFVVLLHQDRADEADDGVIVREDADDVGAALDLAVEPLDGIGRTDLVPVLLGKVHEGENVDLGLVEQRGKLGQLGAQLIGDLTPLLAGAVGEPCAKAVATKAETTRRPFLLACARAFRMKVDAATSPGGAENLGGGALQPFVGVGDDELDPTQAASRQLAQELAPERLGFRGANVEAEHFAPAVGVDADGDGERGRTMRPARRTLKWVASSQT